MDSQEFQKTIEKTINKLNREQQVQFAWRCAVRALPFLGYEGHFKFWKQSERQKHLYSVFRALDIAYASASAYASAFASDASVSAFASASAFADASDASAAASAAASAFAFVSAANASASAAASAFAFVSAANASASAAANASANASANAYAAAYAAANWTCNNKMDSQLRLGCIFKMNNLNGCSISQGRMFSDLIVKDFDVLK